MLKTTILALATLAVSCSAFAHDERNRRDRDDLGQLVYETAPVAAQPGQASLIQYVPQYAPQQQVVVYEPATPSVDYQQPCDDAPTVFISQPAQSASVRLK